MNYFFKIVSSSKPNPEKYSTIIGKGKMIPCQVEAYFLALNKYVNEDSTILDVGFGLGYGLTILSIKAKEVSGVDIDKKVYDYGVKTILGKNPKLVDLNIYDGYNLNFDDNFFDLITCIDVLEHVKDYNKFIKEMLRVSKIGVFISTPNRRPEYTKSNGTPKNYWHLREWSFEELNKILEKHGKVEWNFLNGPWDGPFTISKDIQKNTLVLSPFIYKNNSYSDL